MKTLKSADDYERKLLDQRNEIYQLKEKIEELEYRLEGYEPCEYCEGEGSKLAANSGHPQGPDCIEHFCGACDGEGWVKGGDK